MANPVRKAPPPPPMRKGAALAFQATSSYKARKAKELSFDDGDLLYVLDQSNPKWWLARHDSKEGLVPSQYVSNDNMPHPIIDAARRGNLALLNECLANGVSPNALDKTGSSALHASAMGGHLDCVLRLLKEPKLEINAQNKIGDTPLHNAARKGRDSIVDTLLKHGADRDVTNSENLTARNSTRTSTVIGVLDDGFLPSEERRTSHAALDYLTDDDNDEDSDQDN